jgi:rhodanese-related sulfurtransferase
VTAWLRGHGFEQAQSLRGGIDAWSREVDTALPRY